MLRNLAPAEDLQGEERVLAMVVAMIEQIDRRRGFYLAFVHGHIAGEVTVAASAVVSASTSGSDDASGTIVVGAAMEDSVTAGAAVTSMPEEPNDRTPVGPRTATPMLGAK